MYAAAGYGQGFLNAAAAAGPTFPGAPLAQNPNIQPGTQPQVSAQPQHLMYNPHQQQHPQAPFPGHPGQPSMLPTVSGPAAMMQNPALPPQMANYQTPYTSSPYGAGVSPPAVPPNQFPQQTYMNPGAMTGFQMAGAMSAQQQQQFMQQRMQQQQQHQHQHQHQQHVAGTPHQRHANPSAQGTPNSVPAQAQFSTPQVPGASTPQAQTPTNTQQQPSSTAVSTPQTPTFPSTSTAATTNGASAAATPLSPASESKEKDKFNLILEINTELLYETIQLQNTMNEIKNEKGSDGGPEIAAVTHDYNQCMRRLQSNLQYLAALVDRKQSTHTGPQSLRAPPMNLTLKMRGPAPSSDGSQKNGNAPDLQKDREERDKTLKELYAKLQVFYPGVDPNKEPAFPVNKPGQAQARAHVQGGQTAGSAGPASAAPTPGQASPAATTPQLQHAPTPTAIQAQIAAGS